jgi:hypothetical protein
MSSINNNMSLDSANNTNEPMYFIKHLPENWSLIKFLKRKKHNKTIHSEISWVDEYKIYEDHINQQIIDHNIKKILLNQYEVSDFNEYLFFFILFKMFFSFNFFT